MHRLLGRVIGLAVFLPWLYFFVTKKLSRRTNVGALVALLLGGLQGVLGWYMVKSGLVDVPAVSHFRLAAHLLLAFVCSQWVLWMVLDLRAPWRAWSTAPRASAPFPRATLPLSLLALLYVQIVYGAFVAGKRAGFMSSTFPDMNGYYLPQAFFTSPSFVDDLFNNPLSLHYIHRLIGTLTLATFVGAGVLLYRRAQTSSDRTLGAVLISIVSAQFLLGVLTVVFSVPIPLAVLHQGVAMLLLGAITALLHRSLARPSLS
jgi:cytochrome c oxidase assembly protein subunit 15